ncbi:metallophosphoesterase [Halorarius halobius]|uniref:metallophosphoesterase n=1 Tax=Halorarius halobius TaxID=2962671 RepID=UPI0020CFB439|nr:metallophosphoesterase [Halorarius halobius]
MEFTLRDRAVYLPDAETLVCSDLHLGKDAASNVELPLGEHDDITDRFDALVARFAPATVVVAGDLLHSFSSLPRGVLESVRSLEQSAEAAGARLVVTPGNHDTMLGQVWKGATVEEHRAGDWVVTHGHEPPESDAAGYVVGHDHPTIAIEGRRRPCYLWGDDAYRGADVLVLPSFTKLAAGVEVNDLTAGEFQTPLVRDADLFRPVVWDDDAAEPLAFPPLGEFRRML